MIEFSHLTKRFGDHVAIDDITFRCDPGTVTGFLGPNGAGKSTTMRALVGLTIPTSGTALIDGKPYGAMGNPARRIGVLLDASAQHPGRTGRETLALSARVLGMPQSRVEELLELVQLAGPASKKRVGDYSLGMRQRLGIAHALLGDPGILVLDEPANGLDPEGIRWMRGLLRDFADRGGTVILSSHLLSEVEAVADRFVIVSNGRVQLTGSKEELLGGTSTVVGSPDPAALERALQVADLTFTAQGSTFSVAADPIDVGTAALRGQVVLTELRAAGADLEGLFMELTSSHSHDNHDATGGRPTFVQANKQEVTA
ncbi:MAG: ATP-binding cassette domain-containing protein [Solirubrobacteraceae bacterium]|nr:ATP-binding cassette domain-containing protein [Solirubrobacteraceae bacterium]